MLTTWHGWTFAGPERSCDRRHQPRHRVRRTFAGSAAALACSSPWHGWTFAGSGRSCGRRLPLLRVPTVEDSTTIRACSGMKRETCRQHEKANPPTALTNETAPRKQAGLACSLLLAWVDVRRSGAGSECALRAIRSSMVGSWSGVGWGPARLYPVLFKYVTTSRRRFII